MSKATTRHETPSTQTYLSPKNFPAYSRVRGNKPPGQRIGCKVQDKETPNNHFPKKKSRPAAGSETASLKGDRLPNLLY